MGVVQPHFREHSRADLARSSCRSCSAKMSGEENPASKPTPVQDVQGDGRWMSLVRDPASDTQESGRGLKRAAGSRRFLCVIGKLRAIVVLPMEAGQGGPRSAQCY